MAMARSALKNKYFQNLNGGLLGVFV